jgi:very-short-patch-repair endonuclease
MIDSFILDFYCAKLLLGIEIDWGIHKARVQYDLERDTKLHKKWIKIIRCKNESAHNDMPWLEKEIKKEIKIREEELNCS